MSDILPYSPLSFGPHPNQLVFNDEAGGGLRVNATLISETGAAALQADLNFKQLLELRDWLNTVAERQLRADTINPLAP